MFSKILNILKEEYLTTIKSKWSEATVFKNPSLSDIKHLIRNSAQPENSSRPKALRFFVDLETEDLYVWDAFSALHSIIIDKLISEGIELNYNNLVGGDLWRVDGEYKVSWDSVTFRNSPKQVQKGGMILNLYIKHSLR